MLKTSMLLGIIFLSSGVVIALVWMAIKWKARQDAEKKKLMERLMRRSYQLLNILEVVPDRYLPLETKVLLIDYLNSVIPNVTSEGLNSYELVEKLPELAELRRQLHSGVQESKQERVTSAMYLKKIHAGLAYLIPILREFSEKRVTDIASAKRQIERIRYSHSLATYDLLMYKAAADLDSDRKAAALEKYRTAIVEIEKVALIDNVSLELERAKNQIFLVEDMLFNNTLPI